MPGSILKYPRGGSREFILTLDALEYLISAVHLHYERMQGRARRFIDAKLRLGDSA
jgi:hypothetical protein